MEFLVRRVKARMEWVVLDVPPMAWGQVVAALMGTGIHQEVVVEVMRLRVNMVNPV